MTTEQAINIIHQLGERAVQKGIFTSRSEVQAFDNALATVAQLILKQSDNGRSSNGDDQPAIATGLAKQ